MSHGRLAQLGERLPYKEDVGGSSPSSPILPQFFPVPLSPEGSCTVVHFASRLRATEKNWGKIFFCEREVHVKRLNAR
jgi:hypothetical protein